LINWLRQLDALDYVQTSNRPVPGRSGITKYRLVPDVLCMGRHSGYSRRFSGARRSSWGITATGIGDVSVVRMARGFRTDGTPNSKQVGHVVRTLGIDTHVKIRTTDGRRRSGRIRSLSNDVFAVAVDSRPVLEQIAFGDLTQLERPGSSVALTRSRYRSMPDALTSARSDPRMTVEPSIGKLISLNTAFQQAPRLSAVSGPSSVTPPIH
jgi:hypothetical protein